MTFAGYAFLPIGLLLILIVESRRIFTFTRRNRPPTDAATVMLIGVWWISLSVACNPGSSLPPLYELLLAAFFVWFVLYTCMTMYRANRERPRPLSRTPGDLWTLAAGLLFLSLGSFSAFERSADGYLGARHRSAELDREIRAAPVYPSVAPGR